MYVNSECPEDIRKTCKFKDKGINEISMNSGNGKKGWHILKREVTKFDPPFQNIEKILVKLHTHTLKAYKEFVSLP